MRTSDARLRELYARPSKQYNVDVVLNLYVCVCAVWVSMNMCVFYEIMCTQHRRVTN